MNGALVHFEIPTPDPGKAQGFYGGLFDWSFEPYGDSYHFVPGQPSGGIYAEDSSPAPISVYFGVDDIEDAVKRVAELGGTAEAIRDMPGIGRDACCRDDQGSTFRLFQAETGS